MKYGVVNISWNEILLTFICSVIGGGSRIAALWLLLNVLSFAEDN
jgi:hypothetical protein